MMKLILVFVFLFAVGAKAQSGKHGDGHAENHDVYKSWRNPVTLSSCCNDKDCRPTRAFLTDNGVWMAWDGSQWLPVPQRSLLPPDMLKDGRSHICESNGAINCFSPTGPKS
jgi:hypothetical protein